MDNTHDGRLIHTQINWDYIHNNQGKITGILSIISDETEKKIAEDSLIKSESKFRHLIQTASDGIILLSHDGKVVDVNLSVCATLNYSKKDILELDIHDIDPNFTTEEFLFFWKEISFNEPMTFETSHRRSDGALIPVEVCGQKFKLTDEIFYYGIARDISERKKAEEVLFESERKWRNILINTPQIGITLNTEAKITFANVHFLKLTGWEEGEVLGQDWFDKFIPEHIREEERNIFLAVMKQKDTTGFSTYENVILTRHGSHLNVSWSNVLTKDTHGNIVDVTCLGVDLTERQRSENKLKNSEAKYQTILKSAMDGFWLTDIEGRLLEVNDSYCMMSGYSMDELLSMGISDLEAIEDFCDVNERIKNIIDKKTERFESKHRRKDGTIFDVEISIQYRTTEGGQFTCFLRDISEKKMSFEAIKATNEKMRLAANAAHFGVWDLNFNDNRLEWDDWMFRLYDIKPDIFNGSYEAWQACVHPDDLERNIEEVEQA